MSKPRTATRTGSPVQRAAAVILLLAVVVGFPVLLAAAVGWPLPHTLPTLQQLQDGATSALPASTVVKVLACGAWLAWGHFTLCVLAEVRAELTGRELHVPLGGLNRQLAHRLVTTVLLASAVASSGGLTAANASVVPTASATTITATSSTVGPDLTTNGLDRTAAGVGTTASPAPGASSSDLPTGGGTSSSTAVGAGAAGLVYVVQPPHRGSFDNLWDIAQEHLGDGMRWREIYALNEGRPQPAGDSLTDPDKVRVGWRLRMPADARNLPSSTPTPTPGTVPPPAEGSADRPSTPAQNAAGTGQRTYTVQAGDTLRSIAQELLGDEMHARQLFELNRDREQADGAHLVHADLIRPGWVLVVPAVAAPAPTVPGLAPAGPSAPAAPAAPTPSAPAPAVPVVPPVAPTVPVVPSPVLPGPTDTVAPEPATPEPSTPAPSATGPFARTPAPVRSAPSDAVDPADDNTVWVRTAEGIGALLAAFLLVFLARRRTAQEATRKPGQRVPLPTGSAETTELELRAVEDPIAIAEFDLALRQLAARQHELGEPLPEVRAARITASTVELYLVAATAAPAPWVTGEATPGVWTLHREQLRQAQPDDRIGELPAPYPALVTVGQDDEAGHVLVDLEQICALGVTGTATITMPVLTAVAIELASSTWAQEVDLTLVGLCRELPDALPERPGRLRHMPDLDEFLVELEERADAISDGLRAAGLDSPLAARGRGRAPDAWAPEVVLLAEPVPESLRERLDQVLQRVPRVGIAAVTGAGTPLGEWALQVHADGRAMLQPAGLALTVQQVPADKYADVIEQLAVSMKPPVAGPAWAATLTDREVRLADLPEQTLVDEPHDEPHDELGAAEPPLKTGPTDRIAVVTQPPEAAGSVRVGFAEQPQSVPSSDAVAVAEHGAVPSAGVPHRADALVLDQVSATPAPSSAVDEQQRAAAPDQPLVIDLGQQPAAATHGPASLPTVKATPAGGADRDTDRRERESDAAVLPVAQAATELEQQVLSHDPSTAGAAGSAGGVGAVEEAPFAGGSGLVVLPGDHDDQPPAVPRVRLLGDVAVLGARGPEPVTRKDGKVTGNVTYRATAMIVYLALNPGAVQWDVMSEQLSPSKRWTSKTVGTVTRAARIWLGGDEDGPFFPAFAGSGDYRLRADVRTDWHDWLDLVGTDVTATPTAQLDEALALVQGAPFSNIKKQPNYYAWAEPIRLEMVSSIVDVSHEVVRRVLLSRDQPAGDLPATSRARAALARRAVRVGRLVDGGSELMFRDALLVEHRTGNTAAMRQLAHQVVQHAEDLDSDLDPETEQLLSDLNVLAR